MHLITLYKSIYNLIASPFYFITTRSILGDVTTYTMFYPPYPQIHINLAIFPLKSVIGTISLPK